MRHSGPSSVPVAWASARPCFSNSFPLRCRCECRAAITRIGTIRASTTSCCWSISKTAPAPFKTPDITIPRAIFARCWRAFARLHSAYWDSPRFSGELDWLQPPLQHEIGAQLVARALEQHGSDMPPVFAAMCELYMTRTDEIHRLWNGGPDTLIHGDVHDGNLFLDGSEPGFLDWALAARGPIRRTISKSYLPGLSSIISLSLHP